MTLSLSRRRFLDVVGAAGGSTAAYHVALALGVAPRLTSAATPDLAPLPTRHGTSVVILGAGISGLTAAYELERKGYRVTLLEASFRAGGRNLTLRHGDLVDEIGAPRRCAFDPEPHLYFNAGPARLPGHHRALMDYCRAFGIELAPFINDNRNAWMQDDAVFGGRPVRQRAFLQDTRGFLAELAAKAARPDLLEAPLTHEDYDRVLESLRALGDLDVDLRYRGSLRGGLAVHDYTRPMVRQNPLPATDLLRSKFLRGIAYFSELEDQSAMLMEPVGGMDAIVRGFTARVGHLVHLNCVVEGIELKDRGVSVRYRERGVVHTIAADFCLNCLPLHLVTRLKHNLPADYVAAMGAPTKGKLYKIAFQARQRFWEVEGIYGGISWTAADIQQMWYPPHGIHRAKGIVVGAYTWDPDVGERFASMSHAERVEAAIVQGEKLHPGYRGYVEHGVSVPWLSMRYIEGCAYRWEDSAWANHFRTLQSPAGAHYMMGDQLTAEAGWQKSAIQSAYHVIADIDRRVRAARLVTA